MLQALRPIGRQRVARAVATPPPVGGWNARDALDQMAVADAVVLDNWFPRANDVVSRKGYTLHCDTGEASAVESLHEYHAGTTRKLIAGVGGKLVDVTAATPSTLGTGFTANRWRCTNFGGRLILVNGADAPQTYLTSLSASGFTGSGLTPSDLRDVLAYKSRLFFIENDSQAFWYGGLGAVTGALTKFDLSLVGNFGGNLVGLGAITQDGGAGIDDLIAFFMSSGEVIIYSGSDPGDVNGWALVGVFRIGAPVGAAPLKFGSDLVAITQDGYVPLTRVLPFGRTQGNAAFSDKIADAATEAVQAYGGNNGWQAFQYPKGSMLMINVPRNAVKFDQHVFNTDTGAWSRFRNIPAHCWALFQDALYFGGTDGKVYQFDSGETDAGVPVACDGQTAWNYFGDRSRLKRFTAARPIFRSETDPGVTMALGTDFDSSITTNPVTTVQPGAEGAWDASTWDQTIWGGALKASKSWQSLSGIGYAGSLRVRVAVVDQRVHWQSTTYVFEPGGVL